MDDTEASTEKTYTVEQVATAVLVAVLIVIFLVNNFGGGKDDRCPSGMHEATIDYDQSGAVMGCEDD